jgi:hypothetical protein
MTIASAKSEVGRRSAKKLAVVCPMANEGDNAARFALATLKQCVGFHSVRSLCRRRVCARVQGSDGPPGRLDPGN